MFVINQSWWGKSTKRASLTRFFWYSSVPKTFHNHSLPFAVSMRRWREGKNCKEALVWVRKRKWQKHRIWCSPKTLPTARRSVSQWESAQLALVLTRLYAALHHPLSASDLQCWCCCCRRCTQKSLYPSGPDSPAVLFGRKLRSTLLRVSCNTV